MMFFRFVQAILMTLKSFISPAKRILTNLRNSEIVRFKKKGLPRTCLVTY